MDHSGLHYPNLENCRIVLGATPYAVEVDGEGGEGADDAGPVSMPAEAIRALNARVPPCPDFTVERDVLKKKEERALRSGRSSRRSSGAASSMSSAGSGGAATASSSSHRDQVLHKMMSITNAGRTTCASLLEKTGYHLDRSVEAFFRGDR